MYLTTTFFPKKSQNPVALRHLLAVLYRNALPVPYNALPVEGPAD